VVEILYTTMFTVNVVRKYNLTDGEFTQ